ncbi:hypothetical protein ABES02_14290 [Neobacillus pocheonensis]|uniref:DUF6933 domain-containing protein n=1 Tax=Neobacillus pocheonensis TaxID=363869 RepID=UPI003D2A8914
MFVIGATQKVLKELQVEANSDVEILDGLNAWHMNLFKIGRYQCLILVNDLTLYSLVIPGVKKKDFAKIGELLTRHLAENLKADGLDTSLIEKFIEHGDEIIFTKTHNRSVVGAMVEMVKMIQNIYQSGNEIMAKNPIEINKFNNGLIYSPIGYAQPNNLIKEQIEKSFSKPIV